MSWLAILIGVLPLCILLAVFQGFIHSRFDEAKVLEAARQAAPDAIGGKLRARQSPKKRIWGIGILVTGAVALAAIIFWSASRDPIPWQVLVPSLLLIYFVWRGFDWITQTVLWDAEHLTRRSLVRHARRRAWADLTGVSRRYMKSAFELEFGSQGSILVSEHVHGHVRLVAAAGDHLSRNRQTNQKQSEPDPIGVD